MIYESMMIKTSKLVCNNGQIEGVSKNPRIIKDVAYLTLKESIQNDNSHLFTNELKVFELNGKFVVISGNMRLRVCKELNIKEVPCKIIPSNWTVAQIQKEAIVSNVAAGEWDTEALANEWFDLPLAEWGLTAAAEWDTELETELQAKEDDYEEPENIKVDVFLGDLIEIGEHRLLCGDSTCSDTVARLMNGEKADMVFTDPPYGIDWNTDYIRFKGGLAPSNKYPKIKNDEKDFDPSFFLAICNKCFFFGANCFSDKLPKGNWIVWDKRFENNEAFLADAEVAWYNGSGAVYIIKETHQGFVSSDKKRFHPTQKPVKLLEQIFEKIKAPLFLFDPYSGSGSTMVAAHQLKRKCYGIELDPKYCQVVIDRMVKLDPLLSVKINGVPYSSTN